MTVGFELPVFFLSDDYFDNFNTIAQLRYYFGKDGKKVGIQEFGEFWNSLSFEEMEYYRSVDLTSCW